MSGLLIGYARVSTDAQDLAAQRSALAALGVASERIYVDQGTTGADSLTGAKGPRPGLRAALAACHAGDILAVTKLDRLARSVADARDIVDELRGRQVKLNLGGSVHEPTGSVGRLLTDVLAMVADSAPAGTAPAGTAPSSAGSPELAGLYRRLCLAGPRHVYAQLGQSLDGCIATRTGDACFVTGEEDRRHLHQLRALADAVVVGAGTVLADDPQLTVRDVPGPHPVRVVLDPGGRVPTDRRVFTDGVAPTLWVLDRDAPPPAAAPDGVEQLRLGCGRDGGFAPDELLDALAERGLGRVLVEGGGVTVSRFLQEGALHRLYLTVAPVVVGDGVPGVRFPGSHRMCDALRPPVRRFLLGEDVLFELDLATQPGARHS